MEGLPQEPPRLKGTLPQSSPSKAKAADPYIPKLSLYRYTPPQAAIDRVLSRQRGSR